MIDAMPLVRTRLLQCTPVTALVGDRVFPNFIPRGHALPAIALRPSSFNRDSHLDGQLEAETHRVEVRCAAMTRAEALAIGQAVEGSWRSHEDRAPDGLNGWMGEVGAIDVVSCELSDGSEDFEYLSDGSDQAAIIVIREFELVVAPG